MNDRPRRVLHFAVTGALLGGGVALGGCNKNDHTVNVAPENPEPEPTMVNPVMEPDPAEGETPETTAEEPPHVNTGPQ